MYFRTPAGGSAVDCRCGGEMVVLIAAQQRCMIRSRANNRLIWCGTTDPKGRCVQVNLAAVPNTDLGPNVTVRALRALPPAG